MNEKDLRTILSKNLRRYRNYRKFTQAEFAEKINISIPFLSDIENGKKWVSPHTLVKMADTLHIEAYELLKPENTLPDNDINIIETYTADIYSTFGKILNDLCTEYISNIANK
ncbi:MAG: helix-turn-helix domain-containing protein [Treponema sp.]|jgi:transcriptional regulator with XRE-family HTH domain|nr:helix-turn-helix domain-containing protein [Treponema sp.]